MGDYLNAAKEVLLDAGCPTSAREITAKALGAGILESDGKTPWQTMKSKLSTVIMEKAGACEFMRTAPGLFALRSWVDRYEEYVAQRFEKQPLDEEILVFPASRLFEFIQQPGLHRNDCDIESLLRACYSMQRIQAEVDQSVIQLVSFYLVQYDGKLLTHKRTKRLPESRLHGFYSLGFGGHLNPDDIPTLFISEFSDVRAALPYIMRELEEELILPKGSAPDVEFCGLLYDESRPVSRQHLGMVYDVSVDTAEFEIGERGFLTNPKFESIEEIVSRIDEFENWSQLIARQLAVAMT